jgi:hypothetical protein
MPKKTITKKTQVKASNRNKKPKLNRKQKQVVKKRLRKKPFFITLGIILLIILGLVIYLLLNKSNAPSCTKDMQELLTKTSSMGINLESYKILSGQCNFERGGFIKLKLEKKSSNEILDIYYHWGFCSSAGTDCGFQECVKSYSKTNQDYDSIKSVLCTYLDDYRYIDEPFLEGGCPGELNTDYDNSEIVQNQCKAGDFEQIIQNTRTISVNQISERCTGSVQQASFDCLNIKT